MSAERSPRFPSDSLPEVISRTERLYAATGRSPVAAEIAAQAIGYRGLNGASRTALAAISYYGLIQREGDKHRLSDLGLRLIRPLNDSDRLAAARTAAFRPAIFADIEKNHGDCAESVLASILLHSGFTEEGSRRAAKVFKENVAFLKSLGQGVVGELAESVEPAVDVRTRESGIASAGVDAREPEQQPAASHKVLAQYQIPLGSNHAQLIFTGEELVAEDFDALADYVAIFKKQFERRSKGSAGQPSIAQDSTAHLS